MKKETKKKQKAKKPSKRTRRPSVVRDISKQSLADLTGFTLRYITKLMGMGMPHAKRKSKKGGKRRIWYNYEECVLWMSTKGILSKTSKDQAAGEVAAGMAAQMSNSSDTNDSGPKLSSELLNQVGMEGSLERLKLQEYNASRVIINKLKDNASQAQLDAAQKLHTRCAVALRQMEDAVLKHKYNKSVLVEYELMVQAWVRICVGIKNAVLGIPNACIPTASKLLTDKEAGPIQLSKILDEECRRALNALPDEIPTGQQSNRKMHSSPDST